MQRRLSQEELAELCDFHPTYIGQLERGEKNATLESVSKLSRGLGMSLDDAVLKIFFGGLMEAGMGKAITYLLRADSGKFRALCHQGSFLEGT